MSFSDDGEEGNDVAARAAESVRIAVVFNWCAASPTFIEPHGRTGGCLSSTERPVRPGRETQAPTPSGGSSGMRSGIRFPQGMTMR